MEKIKFYNSDHDARIDAFSRGWEIRTKGAAVYAVSENGLYNTLAYRIGRGWYWMITDAEDK